MTDREVEKLNKQIYKRLEAALSLNLRQQIFLAVCDDCSLRNQIAKQLAVSLNMEDRISDRVISRDSKATFARDQTGDAATKSYPLLVSLKLNVRDPNPVSEIATWLRQNPNGERSIARGFQILGVEQLTRQPSRIQQQFLNYLQMMGQSWPLPLESTLLLWMPRPWLLSIQQSAPDFWRCRTGIFEFISEPTVCSQHFSADEVGSSEFSVDEIGSSEFSASEEQGLKSLLRTQSASEEQGLKSLLRTLNAYRDRIHSGEATAANLTEAIIAYEVGIEYLEADSPLWADILNDLGNLYWMRSRQISVREQAIGSLEQSIKAYEIAIKHILESDNKKRDRQSYRRLQNNLGSAYSELARYTEPVNNFQESIGYYTEALGSSQELSESQQNAATLNNLGTAYWNLAQHQQPVANLKQAIGAYSEALSYSRESQEPLNYGMMQNNLGTAYWNLAACLSEPEKYLQMAVNAYKIALEYRTASAAPAAHAATQNNLGTAYWHLANQENSGPLKMEFWNKCISAYQQALETVTNAQLTELSFDIWATHNNLGLAYYQKASLAADPGQVGDKLHHLEAALDHHLQALSGWENQPELYEGALNYTIEVIRVIYREYALPGQNRALSRVPPSLLPEILSRL
ncbi:MAG: tetratricopeptide repeat protein [Hormoscilla sp.]